MSSASAPVSAASSDRLTLGQWHLSKRTLLSVVLVVAVGAALLSVWLRDGILPSGGIVALRALLGGVVDLELSPGFLLATLVPAAAVTVAYAVAAMSVALLVGIPGAVVASGVLLRRRAPRLVVVASTRGVVGGLRSLDELVWAYLLVFVFGLSPWAGVLGIGLPYGATIARVLAERLQDVPEAPLAALRSSGASEAQVLVYGRLPHALSDTVSYLLYRFECAVRSSAVLSFVGLGGLGLQLTIALDDLSFGRAWTVMLALIGLVVLIDRFGVALRGRIQA